jgi:hypothetical protein
MVGTGIEFSTFTQYLDDLDPEFDPGQQRTPARLTEAQTYGDEIVEKIRDFAEKFTSKLQPPLFRALLVLRGTPLQTAVEKINDGITEVGREGLPTITRPIMQGHRPDTTPITKMCQDVLRRRDEHLKLAQEHFSLTRQDVEEAVRQNEER